jgi:hypothetical protein
VAGDAINVIGNVVSKAKQRRDSKVKEEPNVKREKRSSEDIARFKEELE